jgi:hypothetical protein
MTIMVSRHGRSTGPGAEEDVEANVGVEYGQAILTFTEPRGFGDSQYTLSIAPGSFGDLVQVIMRANAEEAIKAFAAALRDGIPAHQERWYPAWEKKSADAT